MSPLATALAQTTVLEPSNIEVQCCHQGLECNGSSISTRGMMSGHKSYPSALPFLPAPHPTHSQVLQPLPPKLHSCVSHPLGQPCPVLVQAHGIHSGANVPQSHSSAAMGNAHGSLEGQGSRQGTHPVCNPLPCSRHLTKLSSGIRCSQEPCLSPLPWAPSSLPTSATSPAIQSHAVTIILCLPKERLKVPTSNS